MGSSAKAERVLFLGLVLLAACGARSSLPDDAVQTASATTSTGGPAAGGAGSSGVGSTAGAGGSGGCDGLPGLAMVSIQLPGGGSFCIDSTEATNAHYRAFVAAAVPFSTQPAFCAWNQSYEPSWPLPNDSDDLPVVGMDWCDAFAVCAWAGKRLCGKIGGGGLKPPENQDFSKSQWAYACTQGGIKKFPYGLTYEPTTCVTADFDSPGYQPTDHLRPVGTASGCVGGYPGVFDMSGNASEWEDISSPDGSGGETDAVAMRGGTYGDVEVNAGCFAITSTLRSAAVGATGYRCCKD
jgi:sulfatase modifying factor 1